MPVRLSLAFCWTLLHSANPEKCPAYYTILPLTRHQSLPAHYTRLRIILEITGVVVLTVFDIAESEFSMVHRWKVRLTADLRGRLMRTDEHYSTKFNMTTHSIAQNDTMSVRLSEKEFFRFQRYLVYVDRGRWVIGLGLHDVTRSRSRSWRSENCENGRFKVYLFRRYACDQKIWWIMIGLLQNNI